MLSIDEAIRYCLKVVGEQQKTANEADRAAFWYGIKDETCDKCALNHQFVAWLKELKELRNTVEVMKNSALDQISIYDKEIAEYKRLLKLAVEDINATEACDTCEYYPVINAAECQKDDCYKWRYADEAEKLLSEEI